MKSTMKAIATILMLTSLAYAADSAKLGQTTDSERDTAQDRISCHDYNNDGICDCRGTDDQCKGPNNGSGPANKKKPNVIKQ